MQLCRRTFPVPWFPHGDQEVMFLRTRGAVMTLFSIRLLSDDSQTPPLLPAGEAQVVAVAVDHVAGEVVVVGVREQVHAGVRVVVDPVVGHLRAARRMEVDAVLVVGGRQDAAVVDAVAADLDVVGAPVGLVPDREADGRVPVRHLVRDEGDIVAVNRRAGELARAVVRGPGAVERHVLDDHPRDVVLDGKTAVERRPLAGIARDRDRSGRRAGHADRRVLVVDPTAQAAILPRLEDRDQLLEGPKRRGLRAGGLVVAGRRRDAVAARRRRGAGGRGCENHRGGRGDQYRSAHAAQRRVASCVDPWPSDPSRAPAGYRSLPGPSKRCMVPEVPVAPGPERPGKPLFAGICGTGYQQRGAILLAIA